MQPVSITTDVVSLNLDQDKVNNSIQHYVIKFVSDLRPVDGFRRVIPFSPPNILTATI
jgi:hypothetical protein